VEQYILNDFAIVQGYAFSARRKKPIESHGNKTLPTGAT